MPASPLPRARSARCHRHGWAGNGAGVSSAGKMLPGGHHRATLSKILPWAWSSSRRRPCALSSLEHGRGPEQRGKGEWPPTHHPCSHPPQDWVNGDGTSSTFPGVQRGQGGKGCASPWPRLLIKGPQEGQKKRVTITRAANTRPWAPRAKGTSGRAISGHARNRPGTGRGGEALGAGGPQSPGWSRPICLSLPATPQAPLPQKLQLQESHEGWAAPTRAAQTWDALQPAMLQGTAPKWGGAITASTGPLRFWGQGTHTLKPPGRESPMPSAKQDVPSHPASPQPCLPPTAHGVGARLPVHS